MTRWAGLSIALPALCLGRGAESPQQSATESPAPSPAQSATESPALSPAQSATESPALSAPQSASEDRKIAPQDVLNIYIIGEKDIPYEFAVTSTGLIQFPFLEMVEVKDKTPAEASAYLKEMLSKDYFVDPQVLVSVKQYRKQFVRVIGQVAKAGLVELPSEQRFDVIDVIAAAGGLNNLANKGKISVTRKGKTEIFSLKKLKEVKDPAQRVWIEPDDTIEVGESFL